MRLSPQDLMQLAKDWVALALDAYGPIRPPQRIRCKLTGATAMILNRGTYTLVVFRGSNSLVDWVFNCLPIPVRYGRGSVHWGMAAAHKSIWKAIAKRIPTYQPVYFVGHSLGGAMAELSCDFIYRQETGYVAYGKPHLRRKGVHPSIGHLKVKLSVVQGSDVVTTLPRFMFGPHPDQDVLYLGNDERNYWQPDEDFIEADRTLRGTLTHHFMAGYMERLASLEVDAVDFTKSPVEAVDGMFEGLVPPPPIDRLSD